MFLLHTLAYTHAHTHTKHLHSYTNDVPSRKAGHTRTLACLLVSLVGGDEKKADDGKGLTKREEEG